MVVPWPAEGAVPKAGQIQVQVEWYGQQQGEERLDGRRHGLVPIPAGHEACAAPAAFSGSSTGHDPPPSPPLVAFPLAGSRGESAQDSGSRSPGTDDRSSHVVLHHRSKPRGRRDGSALSGSGSFARSASPDVCLPRRSWAAQALACPRVARASHACAISTMAHPLQISRRRSVAQTRPFAHPRGAAFG